MPICPKKICSPEYSRPLPHTGLVALWTASLHAESQSAILAPFGNLSTPRGALFLKGKPLISVSIWYIWLISFGNLSIREDIIDGLWIRDHCPSSWKKDLGKIFKLESSALCHSDMPEFREYMHIVKVDWPASHRQERSNNKYVVAFPSDRCHSDVPRT